MGEAALHLYQPNDSVKLIVSGEAEILIYGGNVQV